MKDAGTGGEGGQLEVVEVHDSAGFRIGGEEDLKTMVEEKAILLTGPDATARLRGGFKEVPIEAGFFEDFGAGEAGHAAADDEDLGVCHE